MALDKSVVKRIADQTWKRGDVVNLESMLKFAQAIYALGVAEERKRLTKQFDEAGWSPYAELIRKGE